MKKCPYCAELIQDDAILCRYCHSDLTNNKEKTPNGKEKSRLNWSGSFKFSLSIAIIYAIGTIFQTPSVLGNLSIFAFEIFATYFAWQILSIGLLLIWNIVKTATSPQDSFWIVIIALVLIALGIGYSIFKPSFSPLAYKNESETLSIPTEETKVSYEFCTYWNSLSARGDGIKKNKCIYGIVSEVGITGGTLILQEKPITLFGNSQRPTVNFQIYHTQAHTFSPGDCVVAIGDLTIADEKPKYLKNVSHINICPDDIGPLQ